MKYFLYPFFILITALAFGQDDMYFDPSTDYEKNYRSQQTSRADSDYEAPASTNKRSSYSASDYNPRYYSSRLQRFHNAGPAFGAANPMFSPGVQVFVSNGPRFGMNRWNSWNQRNSWNRWNSFNSWNSWNRWDRWNSPGMGYNSWNTWNSWNSWGNNPYFYNDPYFCPSGSSFNNLGSSNNSSRSSYYGPRYNSPVNNDFSKSRLRTTGNTDINSRSNNTQSDQERMRSRSMEQQQASESRFSGQDRNRSNTNKRSLDKRNTEYSKDDFKRTYRSRQQSNKSYDRSYRNNTRTNPSSNNRSSNGNLNRTRSSTPRSYQPRSNTRSNRSINRSSTRSRSRSTRSSGGNNLRRSGGN